MGIIVQKYGGSSVSDVEKIHRVAARIAQSHQRGKQVVAVVSAMGNTTNELLALAHAVAPRPDRRELDMLISVGERITMSLLAMCLRDLGVPARSLTGSQSGIITDENHADARVVEVRPQRLHRTLKEGYVAIVAGFQGVSRTREVTTLGRGGSDTTAVVLAAALGAEYCEICSDVDGVWSSDPRAVPQAQRVHAMSLSEGLALARGGAKVLFEDAVRYARDHGVAIHASSTFGPGAGTRLHVEDRPQQSAIAVTGDDQLVGVARTELSRWTQAGGRVRRLVGPLAHVDLRNVHDHTLRAPAIAVITAVGSGLTEQHALLEAADQALAAASVQVQSRGASGDAAWWQVSPSELQRAVATVHQALLPAS